MTTNNLEDQAPANTFKALLQTGNNAGVLGSVTSVRDGGGKDTALAISTNSARIDGALQVTGNSSVGGDLTVTGDFTVNGTSTTINTQTLEVEDHNIVIGSGTPSSDLQAPDYPQAGILWGEGANGADSPIRLTYSSDDGKGFSFEGANVGIGTTSPDLKFEVANEDSSTRSKVSLEPTSQLNRSLDIYSHGVINSYNTNIPSVGSSGLQFQVGGQTYLNIKGGDPQDPEVGNVGIGTTDPGSYKLKISGGDLGISSTSDTGLNIEAANNALSSVHFSDTDAQNEGSIVYIHTANALRFFTNRSESPYSRMTIDDQGRVGIGTVSPSRQLHLAGVMNADGESSTKAQVSLDTNSVNRSLEIFSNGVINSYNSNSTVRGTDGLVFQIGGEPWLDIKLRSPALPASNTVGDVLPGKHAIQSFGNAAKSWDDIYAINPNIQTSDRELKQDIEELSEAETRVAVACKGLLRKYRWKDSVAEKGDDARIHFGIMAQDLEAAFAAEGLDAGRYGMFVKNTWWEADRVIPAVEAVEAVEAVYDEEGNEVSPAVSAVEAQPERTEIDIFNNIEDAPEGATEVTQRGVRYAELLAFIIAAI